ncbi:hypothetical protein MHN80_16315 [Gordonia McavH-238-E]|uniref:hypothetical protein n=1 Tax=Gordonia sp. McavH-238-E TaxID=2917736 RepID=UPI001EF47E2E|nr:hypothetical protein [Gordonia sp. McavH-238-E]MCG7633878.1 hypothetical protein [Gordonia sp. McavH-238-E]
MTSPTPGEHEPDRASPNPQASDPSDDAATTPISPTPTPTPGANPHDSLDANGSAAHGMPAESHPVAPKTAPARSALIAGAAGLAIVAGALGFGAGYITGDTTSERPAPAAVWQQGGNGPGMGGGPQMNGPQMNGPQMGQPGMGGLPGRQNRDGEGDPESDEQDGQNTTPGAPTQQQGQADTGA